MLFTGSLAVDMLFEGAGLVDRFPRSMVMPLCTEIPLPNTTCLGLAVRTAEKRPGVLAGGQWGGSPIPVPWSVWD